MLAGGEDEAPLELPAVTKRAIDKFRRVVPRRKPQTIEISSDRLAAAEASLRDNPPALPASTDKGHDV